MSLVKTKTCIPNQVVQSAWREIGLLRELRTRLIADVVTGKLDVRAAVASLSDDVEEREPLDVIEAEGVAEEIAADDTDEVPEELEV